MYQVGIVLLSRIVGLRANSCWREVGLSVAASVHTSAHWNLSACILLLRILGQAYLGKWMMMEVGEPLGGPQAVQRQV